MTLLEERLGSTAQEQRPTRDQLRLARQFDTDIVNLSKLFMRDILAVLEEFGKEIERIALEVLDTEKRIDLSTKDSAQDTMDSLLIAEAVIIAAIIKSLEKVYEKHYIEIFEATGRRVNGVFDFGFLSSTREPELLAAGINRVHLLDLEGATRRSVYRHLSFGREEGEAVAQLARRLRDFVPAGRFKKKQTRALLIARTETTRAQTFAAAEIYKQNNVTEVLILDSRKGSFDAECDSLNGKRVSITEGEALMADEHPNGTRRMIAMPPEPIEDIE